MSLLWWFDFLGGFSCLVGWFLFGYFFQDHNGLAGKQKLLKAMFHRTLRSCTQNLWKINFPR